MTIAEIKSLLPHREPFLFLDGVQRLEENLIEAYRDVRPDEFYFAGHFPGNPILPGVLQVEAIAQAGILLARARQPQPKKGTTLFAAIEKVRFRRIIRPGERMVITATIQGEKAGVYRIEGKITVAGEIACTATVTGVVRDL